MIKLILINVNNKKEKDQIDMTKHVAQKPSTKKRSQQQYVTLDNMIAREKLPDKMTHRIKLSHNNHDYYDHQPAQTMLNKSSKPKSRNPLKHSMSSNEFVVSRESISDTNGATRSPSYINKSSSLRSENMRVYKAKPIHLSKRIFEDNKFLVV